MGGKAAGREWNGREKERGNSSRGYRQMLSNPQKPYSREADVRFLRVPQEGRRPSCVTAQFYSPAEAKTGVPGEASLLSWLFCVHLYAFRFRTSFLREQVKSYYPLCDHRLKALKIGRWMGSKCVGQRASLGAYRRGANQSGCILTAFSLCVTLSFLV